MRKKWPGQVPDTNEKPSPDGTLWGLRTPLARARWRFAWRVANSQTVTGSDARRTIHTVLEENAETLMRVPGVVGTALSESSGQPYVRVFVDKMTPELLEQIPSSLEGYAVAVEETGGSVARDRD